MPYARPIDGRTCMPGSPNFVFDTYDYHDLLSYASYKYDVPLLDESCLPGRVTNLSVEHGKIVMIE